MATVVGQFGKTCLPSEVIASNSSDRRTESQTGIATPPAHTAFLAEKNSALALNNSGTTQNPMLNKATKIPNHPQHCQHGTCTFGARGHCLSGKIGSGGKPSVLTSVKKSTTIYRRLLGETVHTTTTTYEWRPILQAGNKNHRSGSQVPDPVEQLSRSQNF